MPETAASKRASAKARTGERNVIPPDLERLGIAVERDFKRAEDRFRSTVVVVKSHTLWRHEDGRDLCDHCGSEWPCSTIIGLGFIYDVPIDEAWQRSK